MSADNFSISPTNYDLFADIYDAEYAESHAIAGDIEFYKSYAASSSAPMLDLGCGTGRIAIALAEAGAKVVGIDISTGMLAKAKTKAKALPENVQKRLSFVHADMRSYKLDPVFGFAYFSTFR